MSSRRGNQRENRTLDLLRETGWFGLCGRASRGPADVVALREGHRPMLVQVKSDRKSPWDNFRPADRAELIEAAQQAGGDPWLLWWPPRGKPQWLARHDWPGEATA